MAVTFKNTKPSKRPPRSGNTLPRPVLVDLSQPGRLRVGHLLTLLAVSSTVFYARKAEGIYPAPDGYEGRFPYWNTATVRAYLEGGK